MAGESSMRHDRRPKRPCVVAETPTGTVYEMDVWLTLEEIALLTQGRLMPAATRYYEPWLRITCGADHEASAGIDIKDDDDGA